MSTERIEGAIVKNEGATKGAERMWATLELLRISRESVAGDLYTFFSVL